MRGKFIKIKSIPMMAQNKLFIKARNSVLSQLNESNVGDWLRRDKHALKTDKIEYIGDVIRQLESIGNTKLANYIKEKYG